MSLATNRRSTLIGSLASIALVTPVAARDAAMNEAVTPPQKLCIYYGQPSEVNGSDGDMTQAVATFMNCDVIVLGDGLEHAEHQDHAFTARLVGTLNEAGKSVFGYVDLGVTTQNLDEASLRTYVDEWRAMGAKGIFFDDAGYDYGVTRMRQNAAVDYAHEAQLSVFMNAWDIDDVLGDLDESDQPVPPHLRSGDWYLAESWLIASGAYQRLDAWSEKADKALRYSRTKGIRIAAVSTTGLKKAGAWDYRQKKFGLGWWGAAMYGLTAWQWSDAAYGAADNVLRTYDFGPSYGGRFLDDVVRYSGDSAVFRRYTRATDAGWIFVKSVGSVARGGFRR